MAINNLFQNHRSASQISNNDERQKSLIEKTYEGVKNPYEGVETPQLGFIQRALDWLGLTNIAEKNRYQHDIMSNQWESEHQSALADITYNSPEIQAQQMRAAGINPDLAGLQNYEADSSNAANSLQPDLAANDVALEGTKNLLSAVSGGIQMYIGVMNGIVDLKDKIFELNKNRSDFIQKEAQSAFGRMQRDAIDEGNTVTVYPLGKSPYLSHISNKRLRKATHRYIYDNMNTWQAIAKERYKQEKDFFVSRNEAEEEKTKYGNLGYDPNDLEFVDILAELNNLRLNEAKAATKYGISDAYFKRKANEIYYGGDNSYFETELKQGISSMSEQIKGQKEENRLKAFQNEIQKMQMNFYRKLNNDPTGIGQFILFNVLNSTGASMLEGLASGAMKAIPQTRYFHHLR